MTGPLIRPVSELRKRRIKKIRGRIKQLFFFRKCSGLFLRKRVEGQIVKMPFLQFLSSYGVMVRKTIRRPRGARENFYLKMALAGKWPRMVQNTYENDRFGSEGWSGGAGAGTRAEYGADLEPTWSQPGGFFFKQNGKS